MRDVLGIIFCLIVYFQRIVKYFPLGDSFYPDIIYEGLTAKPELIDRKDLKQEQKDRIKKSCSKFTEKVTGTIKVLYGPYQNCLLEIIYLNEDVTQ